RRAQPGSPQGGCRSRCLRRTPWQRAVRRRTARRRYRRRRRMKKTRAAGFPSSVADAEPAIDEAEQPDRSDQQELDVLEEGRLPAFDPVPDELPDPGDDEDRERDLPQRRLELRQRMVAP